jgi:CheY-like chemotaxis protein
MSGETILVVDDSPTICKLVELSLAKAGYRVATSRTGEGGIEAAQANRPDLILLDFLLPDLKGDDVCRAISGNMSLADVPVIVMSAKGEEVGECFSAMPNVMNIISKPFSPDALLAVVSHTLERTSHKPDQAEPVVESDSRIDIASLVPSEGKDIGAANGPTDPNAALAGDLAVISIADVLLLLQDRGHTGTVTLSHGRARMNLYLGQGRVDFAGANGVSDEFLLGRFLVSGGFLADETLARVLAERKAADSNELLGAYLCSRGLLTPRVCTRPWPSKPRPWFSRACAGAAGASTSVPTELPPRRAKPRCLSRGRADSRRFAPSGGMAGHRTGDRRLRHDLHSAMKTSWPASAAGYCCARNP